jgi:UDP-glucose 4-epimerase
LPETRRCLVIGGAGFIGSHLTETLVKRGDEILVLDALSSGNFRNISPFTDKKDFMRGDVSKAEAIEKCVRILRPQIIFNLAATNLLGSLKDPMRDLMVTGAGTINLLEAARKSHFVERVVFASSGSVYGEARYSPQDEGHPLEPTSPYGAAKLLAEKYLTIWKELYDISYSSLRLYNVYGPRQDHSRQGGVIPIFISRMLRGQRPMIEGSGRQKRCFTYVTDVVRAFILAAQHPQADGLTFNVASKEVCTVLELVEKLNGRIGTSVEPVFGPPRPGDIMDFRPDIGLAEKKLGYKPRVTLDEGLASTIDWFRRGRISPRSRSRIS